MEQWEQIVLTLYLDKYFSVKQIADQFNVSMFKIRSILDKHHVKRRKIGEAIAYLNLTKHSKGGFNIKEKLNDEEEKLRIAGIMLYWGEGTKTGGSVAFSNSDPEMIKNISNVFKKNLRDIGKSIESFAAHLPGS